MQCSSPVPISRGLVVPSPAAALVASADGNVLEVRDLYSLEVLHSITTSGTHISHIVWAANGSLLAAASAPSNSVVVVNSVTGTVVADVHDSPLAIAALYLWHDILIVVAAHSLGLTFFSVSRARVLSILPFSKHRNGPILAFSPCGAYTVFATRKNAVDGLAVVNSDGRIVTALQGPGQLAGICTIAGIRWLPTGILIWGAPLDPLNYSAIALLSPSGMVLSYETVATQEQIEDTCEKEPEQNLSAGSEYGDAGLGIKCVTVNPAGSLLAVGGYDNELRLINVCKWRVAKRFAHDTPEICDTTPPVIYRECTEELVNDTLDDTENQPSRGNLKGHLKKLHDRKEDRARPRKADRARPRTTRTTRSYFKVLDNDGEVEITKRIRSAHAPGSNKFGVSYAEFSSDGKYVASRSDNAGNVIFIWNVLQLRLSAVLIFESDVRSLRWSKQQNCDGKDESEDNEIELGVTCGREFVYLWRPSGAAAVGVCGEQKHESLFQARRVQWAHDDSALIVTDSISTNAFVSVYMSE